MENELSRASTGSRTSSTVTKLTSTAVSMVPAISEALFTVMEAAIITNMSNTDLASYASIARGIMNKILRCKNVSKKVESLQMQLDVTRWAGTEANTRLN